MTRSIFACTVACLAASCLANDPKPRTDADGIPLPTEAVRRFGSAKFCTDPPRSVAFSPDGKTVYLVRADVGIWSGEKYPAVSALEMSTGRTVWQSYPEGLRVQQVSADPDGKTVWAAGYVSASSDLSKCPFVRVKLSAETGRESDRKQLHSGWAEGFDLRPDGTLAWSRYDRDSNDLSLPITKPDGTEQVRWEPDGQYIRLVRWSSDGKTVFVGGKTFDEKGYKLTAADAATGKTRWSVPCSEIDTLAVSADGRLLAAAVPGTVVQQTRNSREINGTRIMAFATADGKELGACDIGGRSHTLFRSNYLRSGRPLAFTPDGKALLVMNDDRQTVPIDPTTWKAGEVRRDGAVYGWRTPGGKAYLAPGGRNLTIHDAATHKPLPHSPPPLERPNMIQPDLRFTDDGTRLIRTGPYIERVEWEVDTAREVSRLPWAKVSESGVGGRSEFWVGTTHAVRSPDGKQLLRPVTALDYGTPAVLEVVDAGSGKRIAELTGGPSQAVYTFTPDARLVVAVSSLNGVWTWDVAKGGKPEFAATVREGDRVAGNGDPFRVHPKGGQVAVIEPYLFDSRRPAEWRIARFDLAPLKRARAWTGSGRIVAFDYSASGLLAGISEKEQSREKTTGELFVIDSDTDTVRNFPLDSPGVGFAMSPDGRSAAVGTIGGEIHLYDVMLGKRRHTFTGLSRPAVALAFSPDGRYLASESADGPVLLWDVRGDLTKPPKPNGWDAAWTALGDDGAQSAFQAVRLFALHPEDGVPELKKRFAELKPPSAEAVAALVAKLGDADFQTRERAEKELKAVGAAAFPALRKAAEASDSAEVKERAGRLLAVAVPPDQLRAERAVEAVMLAGTDAAKRLLAEWAKGPEGTPLTKAAGRR